MPIKSHQVYDSVPNTFIPIKFEIRTKFSPHNFDKMKLCDSLLHAVISMSELTEIEQ